MRQQIDELTKERDEARELLAIGDDEERIKDHSFKVHAALTNNLNSVLEDLNHVREVLAKTREILCEGGVWGNEHLVFAAAAAKARIAMLEATLRRAIDLGVKLAGLECDSEAEDLFGEMAQVLEKQ